MTETLDFLWWFPFHLMNGYVIVSLVGMTQFDHASTLQLLGATLSLGASSTSGFLVTHVTKNYSFIRDTGNKWLVCLVGTRLRWELGRCNCEGVLALWRFISFRSLYVYATESYSLMRGTDWEIGLSQCLFFVWSLAFRTLPWSSLHTSNYLSALTGRSNSVESENYSYSELCIFVSFPPPKGGRGCLMSPPSLESQGCH